MGYIGRIGHIGRICTKSRRQDGYIRNTSGAARIGSGNGHYSVARATETYFGVP
jgi:hypothetical protein